jgi:hypothetical protein
MTYNIPILFLVFNRPETTKRVLLEIRKIKPTKLYVVADGPRKNNLKDKENCEKVRNLIDELVDWKCVVKKTYRKENLGCRKSVSEGITWFFKNEEMGVILEDDTLPDLTFFDFCKKLLLKYKNDSSIMQISGSTFINNLIVEKYLDGDYFFSKYFHIWGWATWRRAWQLYDVNMVNYNKIGSDIIKKNTSNLLEYIYWKRQFGLTYLNKIDTWDNSFLFSMWANKKIAIQPKYNLVENIGFGSESTNTSNIIVQPPVHPFIIKNDQISKKIINSVDKYISKKAFGISACGFISKVYNKIKF